MVKNIENERYKLIHGDCLEKLKELPDNSVDAVVTDPPYGLGETPNIPELLKNWLEKDYMEVKGTGFMGKCYHPKTEVLTNNGWKCIIDIKEKDKIVSLNPDTKESQIVKVKNKFSYDYNGELIHIKHRSAEQCVTPNHNVFIGSLKGFWRLKRADGLPKTFKLLNIKNVNCRKKVFDIDLCNIKINVDDYCFLLGLFLGDGYIVNRNSFRRGKKRTDDWLGFTVKKERKAKIIEKKLKDCKIVYNKREYKDYFIFEINDDCLINYFKKFGKAKDKFIPRQVFDYPLSSLKCLFNGLISTDGHILKDGNIQFGTSSNKLANDFQELCFHLGYSAIKIKRETKETYIDNNYVKPSISYVLTVLKRRKPLWFDPGKLNKIHYDGKVYCVELERNHILYTRFNGKPVWSGNSWDAFVPQPILWKEVFRVLKPGGHLLSFFGTRTYDLGVMAIRLAGFEVRDKLAWIYSTGFPKSLNIGIAVNKLETKEWLNIGNVIDKFINNKELLTLWKDNLNSVKIVETISEKNPTEIGICMLKNDFVPENVVENTNQTSYDLIVSFVEKNLNEVQATNTKTNTVLQNVEAEIKQSQNPVKYVEQFSQNQNLKCWNIFTAQCDVKDLLKERTNLIIKVEEVLMTLRGNKQYSEKEIINALCVVLTNDLKLTILNQSKTFQNLDIIQKMECVSAISVIITKSIMDNLILNTVNIAKEIVVDKLQENERKETHKETKADSTYHTQNVGETITGTSTYSVTKGTSEWEGWYSALKPAIEPIVVCRKPLTEKTIVENVVKWRTGGFNIDACRINGVDDDKVRSGGSSNSIVTNFRGQTQEYTGGRYPSNVILECICDETKLGKIQGSQGHWAKSKVTGFGNFGDGTYNYEGVGEKESKECVVHTNPNCPCFIMDEQSGESYSSGGRIGNKGSVMNMCGTNYEKGDPGYGDVGGASRFFYVAKASKTDRNDGLSVEEFQNKGRWNKNGVFQEVTTNGNIHTTVKPTKLMQQLVKLVTPPNGVVLDPFMGSGSTGRACLMEGFRFIGMELEEEYFKIAKQRVISKDEEVEEEKKQAVAADIFNYMEE